MTTPEQEAKWAQELRESRLRLIERVRKASSLTSPTRRTALYLEWRKEIGDNAAREAAKFSEAVLAGRRHLYELERMVER